MGRTPKPITMLVDTTIVETAEMQVLIAKGHNIIPSDYTAVDMILSPKAWRMDERLIKYLDLAVKAARGVKYPKREKK